MNCRAKPPPRQPYPSAPNQAFRGRSSDDNSFASAGSGGGFEPASREGGARNYDEPSTITLIKSIKGLADFGLGTLDSLATEPLRSPRSRNPTTAEGQRKAVMGRATPPRFPWIARRRHLRRSAEDGRLEGEAKAKDGRCGEGFKAKKGVIEADITPILHTNAFSSFVNKVRALPNRSANKRAAAVASTMPVDAGSAAVAARSADAAAAVAAAAPVPARRQRKAITSGPSGAAEDADAWAGRPDDKLEAVHGADGKRGAIWRESSRDRQRHPGTAEASAPPFPVPSSGSNGRLAASVSDDAGNNHLNRWGSSALSGDADRSTGEVSERGFLGRLYSKLGVSVDRTPVSDDDVALSEDELESDEEGPAGGENTSEAQRLKQSRLGPVPSLYHVRLAFLLLAACFYSTTAIVEVRGVLVFRERGWWVLSTGVACLGTFAVPCSV